MSVRNGGFPGGYHRNNFETSSVYNEGSVSPNASDGSHCSKRKLTGRRCAEHEPFGVPRIVLPLSDLSSSERRKMIQSLRQELKQIRSFQKDVELLRSNGATSALASSASRVNSFGNTRCSNGPGKKVLPLSAAKPALVTTTTMLRMKQCETLLKRLMSHQIGWIFNTPVDIVKQNIPDYFTIIKHPMDLGTVKSKLTSGTYSTPSEFSADVRLTFSNAMTYNPPGNDVYVMADTLSKFFEVRWKTIEKKSSETKTQSEPSNSGTHGNKEVAMHFPLAKKRKMNAVVHDNFVEPTKQVMSNEDRVKLGRDLGSLTQFPLQILNFLRDHSSKKGGSGDDEIEIDINDLSNDALFQLRDLLDEYLRENQKKGSNCEPCELELLHGSGPETPLMQQCDGSEMENKGVFIGNDEYRTTCISHLRAEKDMAVGNSIGPISSERIASDLKITSLLSSSKRSETMDSGPPLDRATSGSPRRDPSISGWDQLEDASKDNQNSVEGEDCRQDGNSGQNEKQLPPEKLDRATMFRNRFAGLISKSQNKTPNQNDKLEPEKKLRREREELELQKKKEKARLVAEAKEAEEARKRADAQAAAEAKRKLEAEREAARKALVEMEKSVEISENLSFLKDLEVLKTVNTDQLAYPKEDGSEVAHDGLGIFTFGVSNPLEQLGLFMKNDEDDDEADPSNEVEEGEIH